MRILFAVDGSEHSMRARALLSRACSEKPHRVTVFNATPPPTRGPKELRDVAQAIKRSAEVMTAAVAEKLAGNRRFELQALVKEDEDAASAILDRAELEGARLVVMGARGLTPFKSLLLGSVSQKVSQNFPGSVMIARSWPFKKELRVLVCVDGSVGGRRVLEFLPALGLPKETRLTLIHAVDTPLADQTPGTDPGFVAGGYGAMLATQRRYRASLRRNGTKLLSDARRRLSGIGGRPRVLLVDGNPVEQILKAAGAAGTDLIVLGRRGLSRAERFFMGSVSHKVSAHAACSVLVVK